MPTDPHPTHISLKGVVLAGHRVLLARNHRDEWELPGGRAEAGEPADVAVARELSEEVGLAVTVGSLVHTEDFEALPGYWVVIKAYRCDPRGPLDARPGDEHVAAAWLGLDDLPAGLAEVYRRAIEAATGDLGHSSTLSI